MALLFASTDIQNRMSTGAYSRLYARNGGSTVDSTFLTTCMAEADSVVRTMTKAAYPGGFDAVGGTVDPAIIGACVDICNEIAASRHPASTENSGYFLAGKRAKEYLRMLNRDQDARPVTSAVGVAQPVAAEINPADTNGIPNDPFARAADNEDVTGF